MAMSKSLWDQKPNQLTMKLQAVVAKKVLGLLVDQDDPPTVIHDQDRVWSRLEEASELGIQASGDGIRAAR
jgi:hypothetical protein